MTETTPFWTRGRNGNAWVGMPARVFIAPNSEGFNLFVDGVLVGTFGGMRDAQKHAELRYANAIASTGGHVGRLAFEQTAGR